MRARGALGASLALAWVVALAARADDARPPSPAATTPVPVVLLVLDGLPESSLLGGDGAIDAVLHPHFAAFAATSTRFTAVTTVALRTADSLPALLTGRLPGEARKLPIADEHPDSLFALLADFDANVVESESVLRDDGLGRAAHEQRIQRLWSDRDKGLREDASFRRFVRELAPTAERSRKRSLGSLHFLHLRLPRQPYHFGAEGTAYQPYRLIENFAEVWSDEPWWAEEAWRRHALQLRFADQLLGELVDALRRAGLFDEALVVVASLGGASFWPGESHGGLEPSTHPEDVLHVPLLIKRPRQTEGVVDAQPAEVIDLLPTIAAVVGRALPQPVDGRSLFAADRPALAARRVLRSDASGRRALEAFPLELTSRRATLDRRLALLGSGDTPARTYAFGPHAALVGTRVDGWSVEAQSGGVAYADAAWLRSKRGARGPRVVAAIELAGEAAPATAPFVAIARQGVIETVVPAPATKQGRTVAALIPETREVKDLAALALYLVEAGEGGPGGVRLRPLTWGEKKPRPQRSRAKPAD